MRFLEKLIVSTINALAGATILAAILGMVAVFLISSCSAAFSNWQTASVQRFVAREQTEQVRIATDGEIEIARINADRDITVAIQNKISVIRTSWAGLMHRGLDVVLIAVTLFALALLIRFAWRRMVDADNKS